MDNKYSDLWSFIATNLPNYSSRDDVLRSDILFRFLNNEDVDESDKQWRFDLKFLSESLESYYSRLAQI